MTTPPPRPNVGFQSIFAVFLGLILTAFIGVGLYTFYPSPDERFAERFRELNRQQQAIRDDRPQEAQTSQDRERLQSIQNEINREQDSLRAASAPWGRNTSIMLMVFATLVMALSILGADRLPVLNNGLLLGGAFTMVYGVGLILVTNTSVERFLVITGALLITLGLGYVRFVTRRGVVPGPEGPFPGPEGPGLRTSVGDLEARLQALERRMDDAASALGRKG
jgi:uncharacterized membrane protein (DUF106 family)